MKMEIIKTLYMKKTIFSIVLLTICIGFISCKKDSDNDTPKKNNKKQTLLLAVGNLLS
jgi:uncharacterized alpha/beta hydrolase family protein